MAVTIIATAGGATSNAFCTLAEADTYAEGKFPSPTAWNAASDDDCNRALVSATRWLTEQAWCGQRTDDTQALAWPRRYAINPDDPFGGEFDETAVPQRVKDATAELALILVAGGTTDRAALPSTDGIVNRTVDVISTTYASPAAQARGLDRYPTVKRFIADLIEESSGFTIPTERA